MGSGIFYPIVSGDDGGWTSNNTVQIGYNNMAFGEWYGTFKGLWIRFPNINIPQGVNITEAYVKFVSYGSKATTICNANIYFNNEDDAVAPTSAAQFVALTLTGAIAWNNVGAWVDNLQYDTPELKTILQDIVDKGGWSSGNAVQIIIKDNSSSVNTVRNASQIDYVSGAEKAELHVTWGPPPEPSTSIIDLSSRISALRSKWWLNTDIQATTWYPERETFLMLRHDHVPARDEQNVQMGKAMQFRLYNPDAELGIDLTTFKLRFDEGAWYRYGNSRLTFTEVNSREYLVYFNPSNFIYNSEIMIEVYCEDKANNPGIKLEIL